MINHPQYAAVSPDQQAHIRELLEHTAQQHDVTLLYACESGSRAWGFASPDSDYDVRFLYLRRVEHYLSVTERRDVIEHPVDSVLDVGGWDVRKALRLLLRSNAPIVEWLQSPIVYSGQPGVATELLALAHEYFSPRAAMHHYISMARNAFDDLQSGEVRLKRYFYALRPLLAALWIAHRRTIPPMEFHRLRDQDVCTPAVHEAVEELLHRKRASDERAMTAPVPVLNAFIASGLDECLAAVGSMEARTPDPAAADAWFCRTLGV